MEKELNDELRNGEEGTIEKLARMVAGGFNDVGQKLDGIETRLDKIGVRLDHVEVQLENVEVRLDSVETRLGNIENNLVPRVKRLEDIVAI